MSFFVLASILLLPGAGPPYGSSAFSSWRDGSNRRDAVRKTGLFEVPQVLTTPSSWRRQALRCASWGTGVTFELLILVAGAVLVWTRPRRGGRRLRRRRRDRRPLCRCIDVARTACARVLLDFVLSKSHRRADGIWTFARRNAAARNLRRPSIANPFGRRAGTRFRLRSAAVPGRAISVVGRSGIIASVSSAVSVIHATCSRQVSVASYRAGDARPVGAHRHCRKRSSSANV